MPIFTEVPITPSTHRQPRRALPSAATAQARQLSLARLGLLDTPPEEEFDGLARLAASVCDAPVALLTFIDGERQWFKARVGMDREEVPISWSFCAYALAEPRELTAVEDASADERFADSPLVAGPDHVRAYAGVPVFDGHGTPLGTVCVFDRRPRSFTAAQREALRTLAAQVTTNLELRTRVRQLQTVRESLTANNEQLDQFAYIMAHDLLAPIRHQTSFAEALDEEYGEGLPAPARGYIAKIREAGDRASALIRDISTYVHAAHAGRAPAERVNLGSIVLEVIAEIERPPGITFYLEGAPEVSIDVNKAALYHIVKNLLSNAAKFVDPRSGRIGVHLREGLDTVELAVVDDGIGMTEETMVDVFELFNRGTNVGQRVGRGLGLSIANKLARGLCGELTVESAGEGQGSTFRLVLPREDYYGVGR